MGSDTLLGVAAIATALLGGGGVAAYRRRPTSEPASPATEVRAATPAIVELADALAEATDAIDAVNARVTALEGSVWRCPMHACPVRDQLRGEVR